MISLRQIRYFLGVAEVGKVSAAANQLNVSQSAVTLGIQDLEAEIGVGLFERRATGLTLTREGQRFVHYAKNINSAVTDALTSMRGGATKVAGQIRLGLTYTLSGYFVFPLLARFRRSYPDIAFELVEQERPALEALIKSGHIDLALMLTSNLADRRRIASETLYRSTRRLWLSSAHPLYSRETISIGDIAHQPYVLFHADEADESARKYWAKAKAKPQVVFQTSSLEAVRSMVASGFAITILSDLVYRPWSLDGNRVETHDIDAKIPTMDIGIAWKRGRLLSQPEQLFVDYLSDASKSKFGRGGL